MLSNITQLGNSSPAFVLNACLLPSHCSRVFHQMDIRNATLFLPFPPTNLLRSVFLVKVAQLFPLLLNESNKPRIKTEKKKPLLTRCKVSLWMSKTYGVFHHEKSLVSEASFAWVSSQLLFYPSAKDSKWDALAFVHSGDDCSAQECRLPYIPPVMWHLVHFLFLF